jgi:hypothetical protein
MLYITLSRMVPSRRNFSRRMVGLSYSGAMHDQDESHASKFEQTGQETNNNDLLLEAEGHLMDLAPETYISEHLPAHGQLLCRRLNPYRCRYRGLFCPE